MSGTLEVITGPMFAGKTQTLLARVRLARSKGLRTEIFKPLTDTRVREAEVRTHAGDSLAAIWTPPDGSGIDTTLDVVAIDEVQFFSPNVIAILLRMVGLGKNVVVSGLDLTSKGDPFGPMPALLSVADRVEKLTAPCRVCGAAGTRSYRKVSDDATVLVGGADMYEPRCVPCFSQVSYD